MNKQELDFEKAVEDVNNLGKKPQDEELLELYSFYKQATMGDVTTERPMFLDFKGRKKWDSWYEKRGIPATQAKIQYVAVVKALTGKYGLKPPEETAAPTN
ncbi:acyl-CoA-binding protein-like [Lineus longissimus]|uniref:acyl-CoA-binding protein-like n=1 Tax=Lineus longissimus TaxID=88925 RepID=UPI002B4E5591